MNDRQKLLLAVCIGEWATALDHIEASIATGFIVPAPYATLGRIRNELDDLLEQWVVVSERLLRGPEDDAQMVAEARAYVTEHLAELDPLTDTHEN